MKSKHEIEIYFDSEKGVYSNDEELNDIFAKLDNKQIMELVRLIKE